MIPISVEARLDYAGRFAKELQDRGVRVHVDERNEKMQYKIRRVRPARFHTSSSLVTRKWKIMLSTFSRYGSKATQTQSVAEFVDHVLARYCS